MTTMTARQVMTAWTLGAIRSSTTVNRDPAQRAKTWTDAARTYGIQAAAVRAGRIWSGDPERAKATRWVAVMFQRMARLGRTLADEAAVRAMSDQELARATWRFPYDSPFGALVRDERAARVGQGFYSSGLEGFHE